MGFVLHAATAVVSLAFADAAFAQAPKQLNNRTVVTSASVHTPAIGTDGSRSGSRTIQTQFYVSSQGRVFTRADHTLHQDNNFRERAEQGPGAKQVQFSGGAIVYTVPLSSGAGQLRVTFDPSYQSCNLSIIIGNQGGKPVTYKGFNGIMYTTTGKPQISAETCSIREGNAFAS